MVMSRLRPYSALVMVVFCVTILTGQTITIKGRVYDRATGEPIPNATLTLMHSRTVYRCDADGRYRFELPRMETVLVTIDKNGYRTTEERMLLTGDSLLYVRDILLKPLQFELDVVDVFAERKKPKLSPSRYRIDPREINNVATLAEVDLLRAVQYLPGSGRPHDFSAQPIIRSGEPYHHLLLLDDVPLYNAFHLAGIFSSFNSDIVRQLDLFPGTYPPLYGGALSSILAITTKTVPDDSSTVKGSVGIVSTKGAVLTKAGPGTLLLSGRRTYLDFIGNLIRKDFPYHFFDIYGKYSLPIGLNHFLTTSFFLSRDVLDLLDTSKRQYSIQAEQTPLTWGNVFGLARWFWSPSSQTLLTISAYKTSSTFYGFHNAVRTYSGERDYIDVDNTRNETAATMRFDHKFGSRSITVGVDFSTSEISSHWNINSLLLSDYVYPPQVLFFDFAPTIFDSLQVRNGVSMYILGTLSPLSDITVDLGIRSTKFSGQDHWILSPFLRLEYAVLHPLTVHIAYGQYYQPFVTLGDRQRQFIYSAFAVPFFPESAQVPRADHFSAGFSTNTPGWFPQVHGELYVIRKDNLPSISEVQRTLLFFSEEGVGFDIFAQYAHEALKAMVGYSFGKSVRTLGTTTFPGNYDTRHSLKMSAVYKVSENVSLTFNWLFNTGIPYTSPTALFIGGPDGFADRNFRPPGLQFPVSGVPRPIYTSYNNSRSSYYSRMDFSITYTARWKGITMKPYLSIFNLLNAHNSSIVGYDPYSYPSRQIELPALPLVPIVGLDFEF